VARVPAGTTGIVTQGINDNSLVQLIALHGSTKRRRMKTKLHALVIALLPLLPMVLPPHAYGADKVAPADAQRLNINTAMVDQLKALPGIGDAYSDKIIKVRPYIYAWKDEWVQKKILQRATYEQIKYKIIAKQK
jgi:DNA uptake protein ComE-like DNA-binding protein